MKNLWGYVAFLCLVLLAQTATVDAQEYTIKDGDTLSTIAERQLGGPVYGSRGSLEKVLSLNKGASASTLIFPGEKLELGEVGTQASLPLESQVEAQTVAAQKTVEKERVVEKGVPEAKQVAAVTPVPEKSPPPVSKENVSEKSEPAKIVAASDPIRVEEKVSVKSELVKVAASSEPIHVEEKASAAKSEPLKIAASSEPTLIQDKPATSAGEMPTEEPAVFTPSEESDVEVGIIPPQYEEVQNGESLDFDSISYIHEVSYDAKHGVILAENENAESRVIDDKDGDIIILKRKGKGRRTAAEETAAPAKPTTEGDSKPVAAAPTAQPQTPAQTESPSKYSVRDFRLGVNMLLFSGDRLTSFSGTTGYALEATTEWGTQQFVITGKGRLGWLPGTATFLDGASQTSFSFNYITAQAVVGARLYAFATDKAFLRPHIGAAGIIGFASLRLSSTPTSLRPSDTAIIFGYELTAGVDCALTSKGYQGSFLFAEMQMQSLRGNLAGSTSFTPSAFGLVLGLGW